MTRLEELAERLASGEEINQDYLRRVVVLQALDVAIVGEKFVEQWDERQREADEQFKRIFAGPADQ